VICLLAALVCVLPHHINGLPTRSAEKDEEERATWLDTRSLHSDFKDLIYSSMSELVSDGRVNPDAVLKPVRKRGKHQGFCVNKTKSGKSLPYACWKEDGEADEK